MPSNSQGPLMPSIMKVLGYAGLLPFFITAVVMLNAVMNGPGLQSAAIFNLYAPYVFISNAAVIFSNVVSLTAWLALLVIFISSIMTVFAVTVLFVGFASLLWVERLTKTASNYWKMRVKLTSAVLLMHVVVIFLMLRDI